MFKEIRYKLITSYYLIKERRDCWRKNRKKRKSKKEKIITILLAIVLFAFKCTPDVLNTITAIKEFCKGDKPSIVTYNNYENCTINKYENCIVIYK